MSAEGTEKTAAAARTREGLVIKNKMQKTVVVEVLRMVRHGKYEKSMKRRVRYQAHDEIKCNVGDKVLLEETRRLSKTKRWRVKEVLVKAQAL